jgi:hypothetical protein
LRGERTYLGVEEKEMMMEGGKGRIGLRVFGTSYTL